MPFKNTARSGSWLRCLACCALFILLPVTLSAGRAAQADALSEIYQRLQQQPQSVTLNLQYALEAEKIGKLKWALPAYERVLAADPGNKEAIQGIDRIRDRLRAEADAS